MKICYEHLRQIGYAGGSTKGALTCAALKNYWIPLPPIEEQKMIASVLSAMDTRICCLDREAILLDEFFRAILEELMTGRLSAVPLIDERGTPSSPRKSTARCCTIARSARGRTTDATSTHHRPPPRNTRHRT